MADQNILLLLQEKRQLFLQVEALADVLQATSEVDELEACIVRRQALLDEIENLDIRIKNLAGQDERVRKALNQDCERQRLPTGLREIYDASLAIKAVVNRIIRNEEIVRQHLETEKNRIQEKLEEIGTSGGSVAGQYYESMQSGVNPRMGGLRRKI